MYRYLLLLDWAPYSWLWGCAAECSSCLATIGASHQLPLKGPSRLNVGRPATGKPTTLCLVEEQQVQAQSELCMGRPAPDLP